MIEESFARFPLVEINAPAAVSDGALDRALIAFATELQSRSEPAVLILDLRLLQKLSVSQRKRVTEEMIKLDASQRLLGCAMVFDSRLLRGILTAMFWVHRPKFPTRIFSEPTSAQAWAELISERGQGHIPEGRGSIAQPPSSRPPPSHVDESEDFERAPNVGSWILHCDASRSRNIAAERVGAMRAVNSKAYLCERRLSADLSLWLGWVGPFSERDEAFAKRDELAQRGLVVTVSQWQEAS
jgi:hypothetical protein